ncbi:MAG: FKBP-type peptidyl-prolyl cis-trans isomerase [Bacteroidia bacterium]|nr:FKBP-type peptidyl-prolyl cis-trans isomerase [Bacteroidia bacterium]
MHRTVFFCTLFILALHFQPFAQCGTCKGPEDMKVDFCYDLKDIPNRCALFADKSETFVLHKADAKKNNNLSLAFPGKDESMVSYLIKLQEANKKTLSTADILFVQAALGVWETEKNKIGFTTTASGLGYKILKQGDGKLPENGKNVSVHYHGYLENGTTFDNSFDRGQPISFPLGVGRVIKGWDEGIALLPVGTEAILLIPSELGYGSRGAGAAIPPNSTLFFRVQVVSAD